MLAGGLDRRAVQNTKFHTTGTSLGAVSYFPYSQALPRERVSQAACCGKAAKLRHTLRIAHLELEGLETKLLESEKKRDKFSRISPGWNVAEQDRQKLLRAYLSKKDEVAASEGTLAEEEGDQHQKQPSAEAVLWEAAAQPDFHHRNYVQDRVDVRKVNYFIQDNRGQLVENVYLPDVEPRSPRKSIFPLSTPKTTKDTAECRDGKFGLWVPNPTFHKPVKRSTGHWFGAGGLPLESQAEYWERRRTERMEEPAAKFLLRRRPDVLGSIPWKLLDESPGTARRPASESVESMLTARRGYVPLFAREKSSSRQSRRLDPALVPTGEVGAVERLQAPRLEQARKTKPLDSPYAKDIYGQLEIPIYAQMVKGNFKETGSEAAVKDEALLICPADQDSQHLDRSHDTILHAASNSWDRRPAKGTEYFHEEKRGKGSPTRQTEIVTHVIPATFNATHSENNMPCFSHRNEVAHAANDIHCTGTEDEHQRAKQRAARDSHAGDLTRRVSGLPVWACVQHMPAAFVSKTSIVRPDVQLKVTSTPDNPSKIIVTTLSAVVSASASLSCPVIHFAYTEYDGDCQCCMA